MGLIVVIATAAVALGPATAPDLPGGAVARLGGTHFHFSHDGGEFVAASPDRARVAAPSAAGPIAEYDTSTGAPGAVRFAAEVPVAYSPDGRTLAALGGACRELANTRPVVFFETASGQEVGRITPATTKLSLRFGAFAGPDLFVFRYLQDKGFRVWNVRAGTEVRTIPAREHFWGAKFAAVSPDGSDLAVICQGTLVGQGLINFGPSGERDPPLVVYRISTGEEVWQATVPGFGHEQVAFAPDGKSLVVDGLYAVRRYDAATGRRLGTWPVPWGLKRDVVAAGNESVYLFKAYEATNVLSGFDLAANRPIEYPLGEPVGLPQQPGAGGLYVAGAGGRVGVWDLATGRPRHNVDGPRSAVLQAALLGDGRAMTVEIDCLRTWPGDDRPSRLRRFPKHDFPHAVAVSADGSALVRHWSDLNPSGYRAGLLNTATGVERVTDLDRGPSWPVVFSHGGRLLASARSYGFSVWDVATMRQRRAAGAGFLGHWSAVAFGASDARLYSSDHLAGVREWDVATGALIRTLRGSQGFQDRLKAYTEHSKDQITTLIASPDGRRLVSAEDGALRVWDLDHGEEATPLELTGRAHPFGSVDDTPLAASPDGAVLAAAGRHGRGELIDLWDLRTGTRFATLAGHKNSVTALAFAPDGRRLISGGADAQAFVWAVPPRPAAAAPRAK